MIAVTIIYIFAFAALIVNIILICGFKKPPPGMPTPTAAQPIQTAKTGKAVEPVVSKEPVKQPQQQPPVTVQSTTKTVPTTQKAVVADQPTDKECPKEEKQRIKKLKRKKRKSHQDERPSTTKVIKTNKSDKKSSNKSNENDDKPEVEKHKKDRKEKKEAKEDEEDNEKDVLHISNEDYENELNKALHHSKKGPEYEEMTYIKGPFSKYEQFKFKAKVKKLQKKDSNFSMIHLGSGQRSDKRDDRDEDKEHVTFTKTAKLTKVPKDQMLPHRLRKDRQTRNAYRKTWVHNKIKEIGGYILDDQMNPVYIAPSSKKKKIVEEAET